MNKSTEKTERISRGWRCGCCGDLITSIEDGWVEWLASEDERGAPLKGLRIVHRLSRSSASAGPDCRYDSRQEFRNDRSIVEGLSLERFVGSDGLMLLLSFLASSEMPRGDVIELAKRVQIPGYEQARELFPEAIAMGVLAYNRRRVLHAVRDSGTVGLGRPRNLLLGKTFVVSIPLA